MNFFDEVKSHAVEQKLPWLSVGDIPRRQSQEDELALSARCEPLFWEKSRHTEVVVLAKDGIVHWNIKSSKDVIAVYRKHPINCVLMMPRSVVNDLVGGHW